MEELTTFLHGIPLFTDLSTPELESLAGIFERKRLKDGEIVVQQGEISDRFFIIHEGYVNVTRGTVFVANLGKGEHFGEAALFQDVKRTATITANQEVELLVTDKGKILSYITANPRASSRFLYQMLRHLILRLEQTSRELQFERRNALTQDAIDQIFS